MHRHSLCSENTDMNDFISTLAYISQIRSNFLLQCELETLSLVLYNCLKATHSTDTLETILTHLVNIGQEHFTIINNFKIFINDQWFFKLIVLASLRHSKEVFNKDLTVTVQQKHKILQEAMLTFRADKMESIVLLHLIENIIKKNKYVINFDLALQLLIFCHKVAVSPLDGYKYYALSISKIVLPLLDSRYMKIFLDLDFLPVRGIETSKVSLYLKHAFNDKEIISNLVMKVIKMFSNNIENREGSFLHRSILFEDFCYWKEVVWPQVFEKLEFIDAEGEFLQSLIKYWIPQCVSTYKLEFYTFICTVPIPDNLKSYILLETRRKGLIEEYSEEMIQFLNRLFLNDTTSNLALKIVSSYSKKSLYPSNVELQLVKRYLYGKTEALNSEELKCLHTFLLQIGVVGSELFNLEARRDKQEKLFIHYKSYIMDLFALCLKLLKTSRKNIGAQIIVLIWKVASDKSPYLLNYKLEKESLGFYSSILPDKEVFFKLIEKELLEFNGTCPELTKLGQLTLFSNKLFSNDYLLMFIDECSELNSVKAAESVKNITSIIVFQNESEENVYLLHNLFDAVNKHFQKILLSTEGIFKGVLLFEAVLEVSKYTHSQEEFVGFNMHCLPVIVNILDNDFVGKIYQQEIEKVELITADQQYNLRSKIQKIVESLLNNMLQFIIQDRNIWKFLDKPKIVNLLVKIIETSNMRRPTTLSADALKHIAKLIDKEYQKDEINMPYAIIEKKNNESSYKIQLLHNTLQKLFKVTSVQNLTIRRNPESRLIIHALCQSDAHPQKPALTQTLMHLLRILSDPKSTHSTVSAALHCTEILISDNTCYNHTLRFVPEVILQCVEHFKNRNWIVRNGNIQLARSVIDRFLGVLIGENNRAKSVADLFCLFPQLVTPFCQTLVQTPLTDSAIIVMQFFSESQIRRQLMESEDMEITREIFLRLFITVIKENNNHYGTFAVRAYISLSIEEHIPVIIKDVIDFLVGNFIYIKGKHTLRNFVLLLHKLYDKYLGFINDFPVRPNDYYVIHENFNQLSMFLKQFNVKQFDLLLLKVITVDDVLTIFKTSCFDVYDYTQRVWQHNYVPLLLINTDADRLGGILKVILSKNLLECIRVKVLSVLVERYSKKQFTSQVVETLFNVLVQKILIIDDSRTYLLLCYFKVLFLFFRGNKNLIIDDCCIKQMRRCYGEAKNIYKVFVIILLLARVDTKNDSDRKFITTAIQCFQDLNLKNFEMSEIISELLPYLYINASCICDKYKIFKMAVFILLEHGLCDFISCITKSKIPSPVIGMIQMLDYEGLVKSFGSQEVAFKFIKEFYEFIIKDYTDGSKIKNKTYYVEEKTIFVDRGCIDSIVFKFLRDFNENKRNLQSCRDYRLLRGQNKR